MVVDTEPEINIKDLVLDEPPKEYRPFDPETNLTSQDWTTMTRALQKKGEMALDPLKPEDLAVEFFALATQVKLVDPQKFELILNIQDYWRRMDGLLHFFNLSFRKGVPRFYNSKVLFPTRSTNFGVDGLNDVWRAPGPSMSPGGWHESLLHLMELKVAKPSYVSESVISSWDWDHLISLAQSNLSTNQANQLENAVEILAAIKVLSPSQLNHLNVSQVVQTVVEHLPQIRGLGIETLFRTAAALKILSAKEVKVTDQGLEIPKAVTTQPRLAVDQAVPETRSF